MNDLALVQACEERLINAWPGFQSVLMGDWVLRFAQGYSGRANSACAIRAGSTMSQAELAHAVRLYHQAGLTPCMRLTPLVLPELVARLDAAGWQMEDPSTGMIADGAAQSMPLPSGLLIEQKPSRAWLEGACRWQEGRKRNPDLLAGIVGNICIPAAFATLQIEGAGVAYAMAALDRGMAEIGAVIVDPARRGQGFGRDIMRALMGWARQNGAHHVFLQVASENAAAKALYASLGFREVYDARYARLRA